MGFIAKGNRVIVKPESGESGSNKTYINKRMMSDGTFVDVEWGHTGEDFETPVVSSAWTTYGAYNYISVGFVRQIFANEHSFDRNTRFDSMIRLSNTVTPVDSTVSDIAYITAVVKGSLTDDLSTIAQNVIDEFSTSTYSNVLAIGVMNRSIDDFRPINIDVNDIKTFEGSAETTRDYILPTTEAIYLINIALATAATMEEITSLSMNVYQQSFTEFLGDSYVAPGSIGKTEMNPDYKAENAINNYLMLFDDSYVVDETLVITPDYITELKDNTVYYFLFNTTGEPSITKVSLGYLDFESDVYVPSGIAYPCEVSGNIAGKPCIAILVNGEFTIKSLV